jgi:hypothetical protein
LAEALTSIAASSYRNIEVILVNDGGESPIAPESYPLTLKLINLEVNRGRSAAANAGVDAAGGEYLSFLDDDDLMGPDHIETLVGLVTGADVRVAYTDAAVGVYELGGSGGWKEVDRRLPYSRDFDPELLLVDNYIPLNTLVIHRPLFEEAGPFDPALEFFEDWEFLIRLAAVEPFYHLPKVTAEYRHFRGSSRHILGERPRQRDDFLNMKATVIRRHADRIVPATLARVVDGLRSETVTAAEAAAAARIEAQAARRSGEQLAHETAELRAEQTEREARIHDLETVLHELQSEITRLQREEAALHSRLDEQGATAADLYAEIERLNSLIREMESTTAWQWHRRMERLRGRS